MPLGERAISAVTCRSWSSAPAGSSMASTDRVPSPRNSDQHCRSIDRSTPLADTWTVRRT